MKRFLLGSAAAVLCAFPAQAQESSVYVSGHLGLTHYSDSDYSIGAITGDVDLDNTWNAALALGIDLTENIGAELEFSHRKTDIDSMNVDGVGAIVASGDLATSALMLNGYYHVLPEGMVNPYLSAGVGIARHDGEITIAGVTDDGKDTVLAYQAGAGVSFDVAQDTDLVFGYRYFATKDYEVDTMKADFDTHELRIGVKYSF